jgi:CHAT domain-containing protein
VPVQDRRIVEPFRARVARTAWLRIAIATVLTAAAIAATLLRATSSGRSSQRRLDALRQAAAAVPYRTIESRLSGFPHRPRSATRRGPRLHDALDPELLPIVRAAAETLAAKQSAGDAADLHAEGIAYLLMGKTSDAVSSLERALLRQTAAADLAQALRRARDPILLNDFASACLANAETSPVSRDLLLGTESAELSWRLERSAAGAWNRALALERLHLRDDARRAWEDYASTERDEAWRREGSAHLPPLAVGSDTAVWHGIEPSLATSSAATIEQAAVRVPQQLRQFLEESLLVRWARLVTAGKEDEAAPLLATIGRCGMALAAAGRDPMIRDVVAGDAARSAFRRDVLARAYAAYGDGIERYRAGEIVPAGAAFVVALRGFREIGSPMAAVTALRLASCYYYSNDTKRVLEEIASIRREYAEAFRQYPAWAGQVEWLAGLAALASGRADESYACYRRALRSFEGAGERENAGAAHELISENRDFVGAFEEVWAHRLAALDLLGQSGSWRRGPSVLTGIAETATTLGANTVAQRLLGHAIDNALQVGNHELAAYGHLWRAVLEARADDPAAARRDLAATRAAGERIRDSGVRARLEADTAIVEAEAVPRAAALAGRLDAAIGFYDRGGNRLQLANALIVRARTATSATEAIAGYRRAFEVLDGSGRSISDAWERATYYGSFDRAATRLVDLLLDSGATVEALETADATRSRTLSQLATRGPQPAAMPEALRRLNAHELAGRLPPQTALLELATRDAELLVWVMTRGAITVHHLPFRRREVTSLITAFRAAVMGGGEAAAWREASAKLQARLLGPLEERLRGTTRLIIVPDAVTENIPFAALYDDVSRTFLVERAEVALVPAAALLRPRTMRSGSRAAVFGDPAFDRELFPTLPALAGARREAGAVAQLYDRPALFVGAAATHDAFVDALRRFDIVHYTGHAIAAERPAASRLVLAPAPGNDGALYAADVIGIRSTARAIVLSACSAGVSAARWSDGASSLAKAFVSGGATSVAAPLWDLDDATAEPFFRAIHTRLAGGATLGAAVRLAQCDAIHGVAVPPATWASLLVIDREIN